MPVARSDFSGTGGLEEGISIRAEKLRKNRQQR
jgi:hypothetical protein